MSEEMLSTKLILVDGQMRFDATARDNPSISVDYFPPLGTEQGYTSLELLLISLASCTASTVMSLLRHRMRREVTGFEATCSGVLRQEHPKTFTRIDLDMTIVSPEATEAEVERALKSAEDKVCPVWALIKGNVEVVTTFTIKR